MYIFIYCNHINMSKDVCKSIKEDAPPRTNVVAFVQNADEANGYETNARRLTNFMFHKPYFYNLVMLLWSVTLIDGCDSVVLK